MGTGCQKVPKSFVVQDNGLLCDRDVSRFRKLIYAYYRERGRQFPWRETRDPYHIVVSEIMLQQTQTGRVVDKYQQFITQFSTFDALARAASRDVLIAWAGLGYNRRARYLQQLAQQVMYDFGGILPADVTTLQTLAGIGPHTAGSICAFAFDMPTVFIETNIRSVFIATCFVGIQGVKDCQIRRLVEQTLDTKHSRTWYYALMDYGVMLKKAAKNPSRASAHHVRQSTFEGSERQIRGMIVRALTQFAGLTFDQLMSVIARDPQRIAKNLENLCREGLVRECRGVFHL